MSGFLKAKAQWGNPRADLKPWYALGMERFSMCRVSIIRRPAEPVRIPVFEETCCQGFRLVDYINEPPRPFFVLLIDERKAA